MSETALEGLWYRVAGLTPRLRAGAEVHRHQVRGQVWYVLQDHQSGRFFRVSPAANLLLCLLDGRRTVARALALTAERHGAERPTRGDVVKLLAQLHQSDLLATPLPPDMEELARRADRQESRKLLLWLRNPLALRFPLLDPDRFLDATAPLLRPLFSRWGFLAWLLLVAAGGVTALLHGRALAEGVTDQLLSPGNLVLVLVLYPLIKGLHELGHAYATKTAGGEVHELGVMLLVLLPVPYLDASAASAFRSKWRRMAVSGAGIMVELALAAIACLLWVQAEPGPLRALLFNVMLIAGVSTLLFNGNPLLRFDGYYVLMDLIEVPNLDTRAKKYWLYLLQRHGFGAHRAESPVEAPGERAWLLGYGALAFVYRIAVMFAIALLVATQFLVVGVLLAIWSVAQMLVWPLIKGLRFVAASPALGDVRRRAVAVTAAGTALAAILLLAVPLPYATLAEGAVIAPEHAQLRAGGEGFVAAIHGRPGATVAAGAPLLELEDPVAAAQVEVYRAQLAVLESRFAQVNLLDRVQMRLAEEQVERARAILARAEERQRALLLRAPREGRFVLPAPERLEGRFLRQGESVGHVLQPGDPAIRVVVPQSEIDLVRSRTQAVAFRLTQAAETVVPARVTRETPQALAAAPAAALSAAGGGPILTAPSGGARERPVQQFFEIELAPLAPVPSDLVGARVFARFDHGAEPLGFRLWRATRQVFLAALGV